MKTGSNSLLNPRRSLLFVPGNKLEMFPKGLTSKADIICIDLEDAISLDDKEIARSEAISLISDHLSSIRKNKIEIWLRINSIRTTAGMADIIALTEVKHAPNGIMVPKIESPEEIKILRDILSKKHTKLNFHPLIETTAGLNFCIEIAKSSHKIGSLVLGGFDMSSNLRIDPHWDTLLYTRQKLVLAAANAGVDLIDMPYFELDDFDGLKRETEACSKIGFTGKCAIHPKQIEAINETFTPTIEEIERAKTLIDKYQSQDAAFVKIDGILMEKPVVDRLYRTLAIADRIKS
jgi:citrate lyase beta subunit|tara:strand:- start:2364 stop:3239 length:876 start_codon:yes stop_codon:yes gene_type:complete